MQKKMLLLGATALVAVTGAGQAFAQTAEQRIVRLEAELRQLRAEVAKQSAASKQSAAKETKTAAAERPAQPARQPFSWTGVYGGLFAGGAFNVTNSKAAYGATPNSGVGFGSAGQNGAPAKSSWYDTYANGGPSSTTPYIESDADADCSLFCSSSYDSGTFTPDLTANRSDAMAPTDLGRRNILGALGVQAGANYQHGNFVMGVAGDFSWLSKPSDKTNSSYGAFDNSTTFTGYANSYSEDSGISSSTTGSVTRQSSGQSAYSATTNITPKWLSTLRLNAGIANDRLLTFVSGGLAFGSVQQNIASRYSDTMRSTCAGTGNSFAIDNTQYNYVNVECGGTDGYQTSNSMETQATTANWNHSNSKIKTGFALGGGFAYAMTDVAILKVESYYYSLGKMTVTVNGSGTTSNNGGSATATNVASYKVESKIHGALGRVGIDFKF